MSPATRSKADDGAAPEAGAGKRRHDRFDWKTRVQVLWLDEHGRGTLVMLRTQDLSAGGVALLSSPWIHSGRCGAVLLSEGSAGHTVRWIEVLHGRYVPERKAHVIGCRWIAPPENAPSVKVLQTPSGMRLEFDSDLPPRMI